MTTILSLILAFMLSIGMCPAASVNVNPAGCPGDTGIQVPDNNNPIINNFFEDYREKTASIPISKKILEIPLIKQPKTQIRFRFSLSLKEELGLVGYMDSMNLYQAFNQNPVNFNDPMGLFDQLHMMYYNDKKYMERLWHDNPPTWKDIDTMLSNLSRWTQHSVEGGINAVLNAAQGLLHTFNSALIYGYGDRDFVYYNLDFKEGFVKRLDTRSAGRKFLGMAGGDLIEGAGTTLKAGYKLLDHNISEDERMDYERIFFNGVGAGITIGRGLYQWKKSFSNTETSVGNYSSGDIILYHGTSSSRASKIVGNNLKPTQGFKVQAFFAEDFVTAEWFAYESIVNYGHGQTLPLSLSVLEFRIPSKLAYELGLLKRSIIGQATKLKFVDIAGSSGFERILTTENLTKFNNALKKGEILVRRKKL